MPESPPPAAPSEDAKAAAVQFALGGATVRFGDDAKSAAPSTPRTPRTPGLHPKPAFKRSASSMRRHVDEEKGGYEAFASRAEELRDGVGDALEQLGDRLAGWFESGRKSPTTGVDRLRQLQAHKMASAKRLTVAAAKPLKISVFESYEFEPMHSKFRHELESWSFRREAERREQQKLIEGLMAWAVPLVLGLSVGAIGVLSADAGGRLVEMRWAWTEARLRTPEPMYVLGGHVDVSVFYSATPTSCPSPPRISPASHLHLGCISAGLLLRVPDLLRGVDVRGGGGGGADGARARGGRLGHPPGDCMLH